MTTSHGGRSATGLVATLLAAALTTLLAACGVPLSDRAEPVAGYQPPASAETSTGPSTTVSASGPQLWFVSGTMLEQQPATVEETGTPTELLAQLSDPPDDPPLATLVVDPLGGEPLVVTPPPVLTLPGSALPDSVYVGVSDTFAQLAAADQVLLIGQVVLTLTDPGLSAPSASVVFVGSDGVELSVPLPDGRLIDRPVVRGDYISLAGSAAR